MLLFGNKQSQKVKKLNFYSNYFVLPVTKASHHTKPLIFIQSSSMDA